MLGDSSTKKVETFDIKNVETFFGNFDSKLCMDGILKVSHILQMRI